MPNRINLFNNCKSCQLKVQDYYQVNLAKRKLAQKRKTDYNIINHYINTFEIGAGLSVNSESIGVVPMVFIP